MITSIIKKLAEKTDLNYEEITHAMTEILSGNTTIQENMDFMSGMAKKGETDEELLGMLEKMEELSLKVKTDAKIVDMCGTGGDKMQTINVSTAASFVVAAAGGKVAKHGNRSSSSVMGSADIFEYFGYDLNQGPTEIAKILDRHSICFIFAQKFHPAMRYLGPARVQLGTRTAFNILGPLSNPARPKDQLIGVSSTKYLDRLPAILKRRGAENIMTVRSDDGMDEFSTSSINKICMLQDKKILTDLIDPETLGLYKSEIKDIQISTKEEAIKSFVNVLNDTANRAMIETVALNAAGGLIVAGLAKDFAESTEIAINTIKSGDAFKLLTKFIKDTGDITKLEEIT